MQSSKKNKHRRYSFVASKNLPCLGLCMYAVVVSVCLFVFGLTVDSCFIR